MILIECYHKTCFGYQLHKTVPTWLAEMVHILYNILARPAENTQRLFAILKDIDLEI
ncbi:hypothetical protein ACRRTK_020379 [Alexandromys fortis]